ncbi:MAG: NifU family protein, partial [Bacteroidetes bacterium]
NSTPLEFLSPADAKSSPLAMELFKFPFVKSVFIAENYITIFKDDKLDWDDIILELRGFLREYLSLEKPVLSSAFFPVSGSPIPSGETGEERIGEPEYAVEHAVPQGELEIKIVNVLEQYVRPAVEQDGGMIVFKSYKEGVVSLLMRGACSGCPSSTITLKNGIAAILKKFVPEVTDVISET